MSKYSLSHVSDAVLTRNLKSLVAGERVTTADLIAHIAEFDDRRLYAPVGYPSMFQYCVGELHLSEEAAFKRIHAARAARRFPAIFAAVAGSRLHLSAVVLLAPHLTRDNAEELLAAAAHRTRARIERLLAERFPRPDLPTRIEAIGAAPAPTRCSEPQALLSGALSQKRDVEHAPGRVEALAAGTAGESPSLAPVQLSPALVGTPVPRPRLTPLAPQRYALQVSLGQRAHDLLRQAQALLAHQVPSGDVAEVLERALEALIEKLEKRKFAATDRPRRSRRQSRNPRHIPAHVKRAVSNRDGGQCTFVSESGHRCPARSMLEYDHVQEVARGGEATAANLRLRCRAHNQHAAECAFGSGFMHQKREQAGRAALTQAGWAGHGPAARAVSTAT